ncbi:MAG: histidine kinase [Betaproteobacteria bacterium]
MALEAASNRIPRAVQPARSRRKPPGSRQSSPDSSTSGRTGGCPRYPWVWTNRSEHVYLALITRPRRRAAASMSSPPRAPAASDSPRDGSIPMRAAPPWLATTFAGLTWPRFGVFCLVLIVFALSRPGAMNAIFAGGGVMPVATGLAKTYALTWIAFAPALLAVVAAANRGPGQGWRQVVWLGAAIVLGCAVGVALFTWTLPLLFPQSPIVRVLAQDDAVVRVLRLTGVTLDNVVLSATATAFGYYVKCSTDSVAALRREERTREEIDREGAEARLQVMEAQIEPHFLFNTLASIRRLYETDAASGKAMLRHLTQYLTASLPVLREAHSTLGRELALAVAYLNVHRIRMGPRLAVEIDVPQRMHAFPVPPMMLSTLVENAIVHGLSPLSQGGRVRISARTEGNRTVIEVLDTGRGLQDTWGTGVGLANIRARLHSAFGDAAELTLVAGPESGAIATLRLPGAAMEAAA